MAEVYDLTGFQRDLLYTIAGFDHPSGPTIRDTLHEYTNKDITHGQLYPNLDTLVEADLVNKGQIDRRTNFYELSPAGEEAIKRRREWEDDHVRFFE